MFSCRIVSTDNYQSAPIQDLDVTYSEFWSTPTQSVPILRLYGITPSGQKTCMHIHGVSKLNNKQTSWRMKAKHCMTRYLPVVDLSIPVCAL